MTGPGRGGEGEPSAALPPPPGPGTPSALIRTVWHHWLTVPAPEDSSERMKKPPRRSWGTLRPHEGAVEGQQSRHTSGVCCRQSPRVRPRTGQLWRMWPGRRALGTCERSVCFDGRCVCPLKKCWTFHFLQTSTKPPVSDRRARVILSVRPGRGRGDAMSLGCGHSGGRPARPR